MSKTKVGIINVTGYAGMELARLLAQHPEVELTSVTGRSAVGQRLNKVFPHLAGLELVIESEPGDIDLPSRYCPTVKVPKRSYPCSTVASKWSISVLISG